jgi:hypothetical protein
MAGWLHQSVRTQLKEAYLGLATALGAYVGETIIKTYGGGWAYFKKLTNGEFVLMMATAHSNVTRYINNEDGEFDSILSFFDHPKIENINTQTPAGDTLQSSTK